MKFCRYLAAYWPTVSVSLASFLAIGCSTDVRNEVEAAEGIRGALVAGVGDREGLPVRLVGFGYRPTSTRKPPSRAWARPLASALRAVPTDHRLRVNISQQAVGLHARGLQALLGPSNSVSTHEPAKQPVLRTIAPSPEAHPLDSAIASLERAVEGQPHVARYRNDLAAALWWRGTDTERMDDLLRALEHSDTAVRLNRDLPEATFNLALTKEALGLWYRASEQYERYLDLDSSSDWGRVARDRLSELEHLDPLVSSPRLLGELRQATRNTDPKRIREVATERPQLVRDLAHGELLESWADAALTRVSGESDERLAVLESVGLALSDVADDHLVGDLARGLRTQEIRARAARGCRAYVRARSMVEQRTCEAAVPLLEEATELLRSEGLPLVLWARFYSARCAYYRNAHEESYRILEEIEAYRGADRYPGLLAETLRLKSLILGVLDSQVTARRIQQEALDQARRSSDHDAVARSLSSLADIHHDLGSREESWRLRFAALQLRSRVVRGARLYVLLVTTGVRLRKDGRLTASAAFLAEALELAERSADPVLVSDAFRQAAALAEDQGNAADADGALEHSLTWAERVQDPEVRSFLVMDALRYRGQLLAGRSGGGVGQEALEDLRHAKAFALAATYFRVVPELSLSLATALEKSGDLDRAREELSWAQEFVGSRLRVAEDVDEQGAHLRTARKLIEAQARLSLVSGDTRLALEQADRARSIHAPADFFSASLPLDWHLDPDTTSVVYHLVDGWVSAWVLSDHDSSYHPRLARTGETRMLLRRLRAAARNSSQGEFAEVLTLLFEHLVEPVQSVLKGKHLVVVPHDFLVGIPFSSLRDPANGSYLFESRSVVLCMTISGCRRLRTGDLEPGSRVGWPILVVGGPEHDAELFPGLPRLPAARAEAEVIAREYGPETVLLVGAEATRETVLYHASGSRVIHIGSHGRAGSDRSQPFLILAEDKERGSSLVTAADLRQLDLSSTEVVVLSGCDTAGRPGSASPISASLAEALHRAGAETVVASLWAVGDEGTQDLMIEFHRELRRGRSAAEALRQARLLVLSASAGNRITSESVLAFEVLSDER